MVKIEDITGKKFGKLLAIEKTIVNNSVHYKCICDCGEERIVRGDRLRSGYTKSCGCLKKVSHVGKKFGKLKVIEKIVKGNRSFYECVCDCGNKKTTRGDSLTSGRTRSCGCLVMENSTVSNLSHDSSRTRLYRIYNKMKSRCYDSKNARFHRYGGRGIIVCQEWLEDFTVFKRWALENGYRDNLSIDRINNDGNYTPDNCRWATKLQQANNKSTNIKLIFKGKEMTLAEYCRLNNLAYDSTRTKLNNGTLKGVKYKKRSTDEVHR